MTELARTPKQLGNAVRRARRKLGFSQIELGDRAGLRQATISDIEAGKTGARLDSILKVLAILGLELRIDPRSIGAPEDLEEIF
jgi:HTH-type transcriptional regulator / antitoxin HipB